MLVLLIYSIFLDEKWWALLFELRFDGVFLKNCFSCFNYYYYFLYLHNLYSFFCFCLLWNNVLELDYFIGYEYINHIVKLFPKMICWIVHWSVWSDIKFIKSCGHYNSTNWVSLAVGCGSVCRYGWILNLFCQIFRPFLWPIRFLGLILFEIFSWFKCWTGDEWRANDHSVWQALCKLKG